MARDPSPRICSMVQTLDDGDGVGVLVETLDRKQAFAFTLDGDESAAFQRTLAFDRDAVVLDLRETIAGTRARAERAESALAAECTKSAAGLKAIEAAQAGIERLTRERTTAEALAARRDDALATEKLNHDQTKQKAIDLGNSNHNLRNLCEQLEKRAEAAESNCGEWKGRAITAKTDRDEALAAYETARRARDAAEKALDLAEARVKVLEGDAVPCRWAVVDDRDGIEFSWKDKANAEREVASRGGTVEPLYRHPPKLAAMAVDVSSIRQLIEHGKQGCFDLSSFLIVLGNMLDKLHVVDVARLRTLAKTVLGGDSVHHVSYEILAAIGEKGG